MGRLIPPLPLSRDHRTAGFNCSIMSLNEWLIHHALKNDLHGGSRAYVVFDGKQVVGYSAVAAASIARKEAPGSIRRNMPDPIPAIIIGRLAVDHRYQGAGIGQGLLRDALARAINVFGIISRIDYAASIKFLFLVISSSISTEFGYHS